VLGEMLARLGRLDEAEGILDDAIARRDEARTALAWAREAAARKGSTVLVERADRLTAGLDA